MEVASTFGAELSGRTAKYITVLKNHTKHHAVLEGEYEISCCQKYVLSLSECENIKNC